MRDKTRLTIDAATLNHIVIIVDDIEKAAAEWARLLGLDQLPIRHRGNHQPLLQNPDFKTDPRNHYRSDYNYGNGEEYEWLEADVPMGSWKIELIQPEKGKGPFREYYEKHGTGIQHIAFRSAQCDAVNDMLVQDGYDYIVDTYNPANGDRWNVHDTEDVLGTNLCVKPLLSMLHQKDA